MANKKPNPVPEEKQFGLKEIQMRFIANINARANAEMLDYLSYLAIENFNINVTENTEFRVEEGKLYIRELEEKSEESIEAEQVSVA